MDGQERVQYGLQRMREETERYHRAAHAMQSAVAAEIQGTSIDHTGANPKHLRVGINSCLVDTGAVAKLLVSRGVFTQLEYLTAIADAMEAEAERCAKRTRERLGLPDSVSFG